ncbi:chromosome partitioning protein ParA [Yersinia kristensenii]|uniref:chromosome partitioning protein ParA n=1 Tax=Yersinia kristensenii TaxID=28152 RepID=UPI000C146582|nr:chromosome partitioning protein ParA [Yersinia kristensenii]MDA5521499.1 chromosome partitioning protein ParA [Yersinia kristensenii]MDR4899233.1 chromosome partitioning protein ParA [Yersinia kristensenii]MDX6738016.1 chromosome partitioning protein ParA [Yersinia kristensenii]PHZ35372.1 chromosome partitioning protein ParA [Yersinia kristensenii]
MNDSNPIQYMLGDLQGKYSKLKSDLDKLKDFQQYITLLQQRADNDSQAREKLLRLDAAFPNGFKQEKAKMMDCVSQMSIQFKQLETQLKNLNSTENTP